MAILAIVSAGGAPGATTTALALTLTWPAQALMAECDPDGGSVLAGTFAGHFPADRGLLKLALRVSEDPASVGAALLEQLLPLDEAGQRPVLPGVADPFQAQAITPAAWEQIAALLAGQPHDVVADLGQVRAAGFPFPILASAGLLVMVLRPTLRQVDAARRRLAAIRQSLGEHAPIGLCFIGSGPFSMPEIRDQLGGGFRVMVQVPFDARTADRLSDGTPRRRDIRATDLLMQARGAARTLHSALHAAAEEVSGTPRPDRFPVSQQEWA